MNASITATIATEHKPAFSFKRAIAGFFAAIREGVKQYGAPYLNGPLPPL